MVTKKTPYLVYTNDKEVKVFDQSHELMKHDHLEFLYNKMVEKILLWEKMIMYCEGNIEASFDDGSTRHEPSLFITKI